jgi:ribonuclease P protein component
MLAKKHRLNAHAVREVLARGSIKRTATFVTRVLPSPAFQCAVVVSKKIAKTAVERNRIRRVVYAKIASNKPWNAHTVHAYVLTVRSSTLPSGEALAAELAQVLGL